MSVINEVTGEKLSNEEFQVRIRRIIETHGRYILNCAIQPAIGEIQVFAGLPFRVVRYSMREEAIKQNEGDGIQLTPEDEFFFEVEVAD